MSQNKKRGELEGIRGLAACSVVAAHFFGCFAPLGELSPWMGKIYSTLTNGTAAVVVFFVLSGIVLPMSFFRSGGDTSVIAVGTLNRYPRLFFLVFLTVMGSYLIAASGLNFATEAAQSGASPWLLSFGQPQESEYFQVSLGSALWQGAFGTLVQNRSEYNVSLWTMHHELYGSFVTFGVAMLLYRAPMKVVAIITAFAYFALQATAYRLAPFVLGTGLSVFLFRNPNFSLKLPISLSLIALGIFFYSYNHHGKNHWPNAFIPWGDDEQKAWVIYALSGLCFIIGVVGNPAVKRAMNANWLTAIGRYSFAMYASHMLVIGSIASFVFAKIAPVYGVLPALTLATVAFVPALALLSYYLTRADEWWVKKSQRFIRAVISDEKAAPRAEPVIAPAPRA